MTTLNVMPAAASIFQQRIGRLERTRLVLEHHRDALANRIGEPVGATDEQLLLLRVLERPLAQRAGKNIEQLGIHWTSPRRTFNEGDIHPVALIKRDRSEPGPGQPRRPVARRLRTPSPRPRRSSA